VDSSKRVVRRIAGSALLAVLTGGRSGILFLAAGGSARLAAGSRAPPRRRARVARCEGIAEEVEALGGTGHPGAILWNNCPPTVVSPPAEPYSALTALAPTTLRAYGPSGARLLAGGPGRSRLDTSR